LVSREGSPTTREGLCPTPQGVKFTTACRLSYVFNADIFAKVQKVFLLWHHVVKNHFTTLSTSNRESITVRLTVSQKNAGGFKFCLHFLSRAQQGLSGDIISAIAGTTGRLHSEFIRLLFLQAHRETDRFFAASGVQSATSNLGASYFHFRRAAFSSLLKSRVGNIIAKASPLRVNLNLDGTPIASSSHTHPSHSQTSRLLTSSLSFGVPVPRPTQCMGDA
jgi:hypothetical protein